MKKYILLITAICIVMLSCKKSKPIKPEGGDGKLYPVSFNVSSFTQTQEPVVNTTGVRLAADAPLPMTRIAYRLYTPAGVLLKYHRTRNIDANYGKFTDSLAAGNYTVVFLGYSNSAASDFVGTAPDDMFTAVGRVFGPFDDLIYYKKVNFTVPGTSVQNVALERVSAALQLVVKDAIPVGVTYISMTYIDYNGFLVFKNQPVWAWDFEHPENNSEYLTIDHTFETLVNVPVGTTNFTTGVNPRILNTVTPTDITITAYGTGGIVAKKTVRDVVFHRNTKTILTGNLFTNDPVDAGFKPTFKYNFETDSISKPF